MGLLTSELAQWHQWLRRTRFEPPSLQEQTSDIQRQLELKQLARLADERWANKPSLLDPPKTNLGRMPAHSPTDPSSIFPERLSRQEP
jgi:NADH dehydrogenase [ubiquinone] 1 alpha subcomplex assembly factor 2